MTGKIGVVGTIVIIFGLAALGCDPSDPSTDAGVSPVDGGDGSTPDGTPLADTGGTDSTSTDAGPTDAGATDAPPSDVPTDTTVVRATISCDAIHVFPTVESDLSNPTDPELAGSGDFAAVIWGERAGSSVYEGVAVSHYNFTTDTWSDPTDIYSETAPGFTPNYSVAVDVDGDITATHRIIVASVATHYAYAYNASTDSWGARTTIPILRANAITSEYDRATGEALVAALAPAGGRISVLFTRQTGSSWSAPAVLEENNNESVANLDLRMNEAGAGAIAWSINVDGTDPTAFVLPYAAGDFRRDGASALDPHSIAINRTSTDLPQVDVNDDGIGAVVLDNSMGLVSELTVATFDTAAGTIAAPVSIYSGMTSFGLSDVAIGNDGSIAVVWNQRDTFSSPYNAWAATFVGGTWSAAEQRGPTASGLRGPTAGVDSDGTITLGWGTGADGIKATRNLAEGGAFQEQQDITVGPADRAGNAQIYAHDSGDFLVVWQEGMAIHAARCR